MGFEYPKLLGRIKECGFTQETLAKHIGIAESSMCLKLNGKASFKQNEIFLISNALEIESSEIGAYFFAQKVRKHEQKEE